MFVVMFGEGGMFFEKVYMLGVDYYGYVGCLKVIVVCVGDDLVHNIEVLIG